MMKDLHSYSIQLRDPIEIDELNAISPLELKAAQVNKATTSFTVCADQSGLIGLLRLLHGRGLILLSIQLEPIYQE